VVLHYGNFLKFKKINVVKLASYWQIGHSTQECNELLTISCKKLAVNVNITNVNLYSRAYEYCTTIEMQLASVLSGASFISVSYL